MPYCHNQVIDWSLGAVLLRDGSIFCSPNSKRAVFIPDEAQSRASPFQDPSNVNFFQPVWWDWSHGWTAFVPLSPSFLSLPFQPLCWKPRVVETTKPVTLPSGATQRQRRYAIHGDDCHQWLQCELQLARAADAMRMFYHIPGTVPPLPSSFGLNCLHRSRNAAERCIVACRKWFAVWMGFLSYLIAQTSRPEYQKPTSGPLPGWYKRLLEKQFAPPWLDGLAGSSVCAFDTHTVRAGVILSFTNSDRHRPPVQWFIAHRVPCWYRLSRFSEEYLKKDAFLRKLIPPPEILQAELTQLFKEPRLPLVLFIVKAYTGFEWEGYNEAVRKILSIEHTTSAVLGICSNELMKRRAFRLELDLPSERDRTLHEMKTILAEREDVIRAEVYSEQVCLEQGMVEKDDFEGTTSLYSHWSQFFEKRAKRENELLQSESDKDRLARLHRERSPPISKCRMYVWQEVKTSGGGVVYARTLMKKSEHADLVERYKPSETKFYARFSEWDFFDGFDPESCRRPSYDDFDDNGSESEQDPPTPNEMPTDDSPQEYHAVPTAINYAMEFYTTAAVEDYSHRSESPVETTSDAVAKVADRNSLNTANFTETRIIERAHWQFGFVPALGQEFADSVPKFSWKEVLHTLGSTGADAEYVATADKVALQTFFSSLVSKASIPSDLDDLSDQNHSYLLSRISLGSFKLVGENWFIFLAPRSATSSWYLGVDSPAAALYVLRILATSRRVHTSYTLGDLLIRNGVRFRTFEKMLKVEHRRLWQPFCPQSYRQSGYTFTVDDFQASLLQTKYLLQTLPGRAALLLGGIIGRVAREFLQPYEVLDGPSVEATFARNGLRVDAKDGENEYWDDDLTEQEMAIICGTYIMYTGEFFCCWSEYCNS